MSTDRVVGIHNMARCVGVSRTAMRAMIEAGRVRVSWSGDRPFARKEYLNKFVQRPSSRRAEAQWETDGGAIIQAIDDV